MDNIYAGRAGAVIFVGVAQFFIFLLVATSVYPNYSVHGNFISDLGVGATAIIFDPSIVILGILLIIGGYYIKKAVNDRALAIMVVLAGIGSSGVGVFNEHFGLIHALFALVAFVFANASAILSARVTTGHMRVFSVVLGVLGFIALALYISNTYLSLGVGGMERMIVYPTIAWGMGFSGYLLGRSQAL
ncbi:MAG: DUF998 domain-containing protein [Conexivisphaerales archaeon]